MKYIHALPCSHPQPPHALPTTTKRPLWSSPRCSFSTKRRRSTRTGKKHTFITLPKRPSLVENDDNALDSSSRSIQLVLDLNQIKSLATSSVNRFLRSAEYAYDDLRTLVTLDDRNRVVFSCRRSTVEFAGAVLVYGFVAVFAVRVFAGIVAWIREVLFRGRVNSEVIVRRDRSLGGKEVVVARRVREPEVVVRRTSRKGLDSALADMGLVDGWKDFRDQGSSRKLPQWWPEAGIESGSTITGADKEEYKRAANSLVRAITGYRTIGEDVTERDIVQLRRICRTSGVQVSFDTANTRDSFYRAAVNFILNVCSSCVGYPSILNVDGESVQHFIAGLAENVGLENLHAARIVSGAVAAKTLSLFLQSWALEVQGKHEEALLELSKICLFFQAFPPDESAAEMEMVARGLAKNLSVDKRELLMDMFQKVCSEDCHRCAADALGLVQASRGSSDPRDVV